MTERPIAFDDLYRLKDPLGAKYVRGHVQFPQEINHHALLRGEQRAPSGLSVGRAEGRAWADFVWTDHPR